MASNQHGFPSLVHRGSDFAVFWKPPGLVLAPRPDTKCKCLEEDVRRILGGAQIPFWFVNKGLPRPLGGLVLIALTPSAADRFRSTSVRARFGALVHGTLEGVTSLVNGETVSVGSQTHGTSGLLSTISVWCQDSSATGLRKALANAGLFTVGNGRWQKPSKSSPTRGIYLALLALEFTDDRSQTVLVEYPEPPKFESLRMREAKFRLSKQFREEDIQNGSDVVKVQNPLERLPPTPYRVGYKRFGQNCFIVNPSVMIPRDCSYTLVECFRKMAGSRPCRILDLGTGSGALLLSCLGLSRGSVGLGVDLSSDALEVASQNATLLGLQERCSFIQADFGDLAVLAREDTDPFDFLLCNPPYLSSSSHLDSDLVGWEPDMALYAGNSGMDSYIEISRAIRENSRVLLSQEAVCLIETGQGLADKVMELFNGFQCTSERDSYGIRRVLIARTLYTNEA